MEEKPITISWLGHSGFKIRYKDTTLLVDPWFEGNPMFPEKERANVISDSNFVLLSHAHSDHASDSIEILSTISKRPCSKHGKSCKHKNLGCIKFIDSKEIEKAVLKLL